MTYEPRILESCKCDQRADLGSVSRNGTDALELFDSANVEQILWREQTLLHRRQQIGAAGNDLDVTCVL